jgi:hypothetical protein
MREVGVKARVSDLDRKPILMDIRAGGACKECISVVDTKKT